MAHRLVELIRAIAAEHPDFVYEQKRYDSGENNSCVNTPKLMEDGTISRCIVGEATVRLLKEENREALIEELDGDALYDASSNQVLDAFWPAISKDDRTWVSYVQARQDDHYPWKDCIERADDEYPLET